MKPVTTMVAVATLALLSACGGAGDDAAGDTVAQNADMAADKMDQQADVLEDQGNEAAADALENQADATRQAGEAKEEAIDDADVQTNQR
jgi:hypothetical protein